MGICPKRFTIPAFISEIRIRINGSPQSFQLIQSPIFGPMPPTQLSGGVKTLMLIAYDRNHIFNAHNCGDNCAKWILKIAQMRKDRIVINLRHLMDFGEGEFKIRVMNTNKIVRNMAELTLQAVDFVQGGIPHGTYLE